MLMNHPEQFDRVAREWSVKYANAPQRILTQGVSFATSKPPKPQKSKEQELKEQMARYCY
jgi:ubiquitin-conjugating enzyme (huntingtin interacting protein 2)